MISILYDLKGQVTVLNGIMLLLVTAFILSRYNKKRPAIIVAGICAIVFLCSATPYLPYFLAGQLEKKYLPFKPATNQLDTSKVYILVLGSGYTLDKRLPATAQLGLPALGRLAEGIRIHRTIANSVIICSGNSALGLETQAQVTRRAAILLGVEPGKLETLNNPSTTRQEAGEMGRIYPKNCNLIVVTDAIHMPRAIKYLESAGFNPIAAPTNYKVNEGPHQAALRWWPSFEYVGLMNYVLHEYLGALKASAGK